MAYRTGDSAERCGCSAAGPSLLAPDSALFLDFDGTLVELAPTPAEVRSPPGLPERLARLSDRLGGALAIVSGRALVDVDRRLSPFRGAAAGLHGFELRGAGGAVARRPPEAALATVRPWLRVRVAELPGVLLEDKGASLALHFRQAPERAETCVELAAQAAALAEGRLAVLPGKMVIELRPPEIDKGRAIATLLAEMPFRGRRPVFVGDDITDEHGFAVVNERGGASIRVGSLEGTEARACLADVAAVHDWLRRSLAVLEAER